MEFKLDDLKKNKKTAFLALTYEKLLREESELRGMLDSDESLSQIVGEELKSVQTQKAALENQFTESWCWWRRGRAFCFSTGRNV